MARIAGVDIPRDKWLWIGLRSIYGLGPKNVMDVLSKAKVDPWVKVKDLAPELEARIREVIDKEYVVEADLRREIRSNVQRLIEVGSY
ncbi:MAG: 30S ribosomal protein S13, partial [Chloroflexota bacterium]